MFTGFEGISFSVIVPLYNVERYLGRCLDSLRALDYPGFEVVLVDDGSTDGSGAMCDAVAVADPRFRLVRQPNRGLSAARNAGVDAAHGDYVVFVDADDYVEAHGLSSIARACERAGLPDAVMTPRVGCRNANADVEPARSGAGFLAWATGRRLLEATAWSYACRLDFLNREGLRFKDGILYEDYQFTPRMLAAARSVAFNARPYYHYEPRPGSITLDAALADKGYHDACDTCRELEGRLPGFGYMLARVYLCTYRKAPSADARADGLGRAFVARCVGRAAPPRERLKAALFLVSPSMFKRFGNAIAGARRLLGTLAARLPAASALGLPASSGGADSRIVEDAAS